MSKEKIIFVAFVAIAAVAILFISSFSFFLKVKEEIPQIKSQPKAKILTPEEIKEALSKKAESPSKPVGQEQINRALEKKIPKKEKPVPLTLEEIKKALEAK